MFETICESKDWTIDYDKSKGMYRVSYFQDNHFQDETFFDAYNPAPIENAYCPVCNKERYIPKTRGYCCECGHHLNRIWRKEDEEKSSSNYDK